MKKYRIIYLSLFTILFGQSNIQKVKDDLLVLEPKNPKSIIQLNQEPIVQNCHREHRLFEKIQRYVKVK